MDAHGVRRDSAVEDELTRILVVESLGKEILEFQDLNTPLLHFEYEVVVVILCFVNPQHIVEKEIAAVPGGEPLMGQ
jgi:hypothetical protein